MRARLEQLSYQLQERSWTGFHILQPRFDFFWHFHPEIELTLIVRGHGTRLVGDSVMSFRAGDLVLLGPQIPHTWVSDKSVRGKCEAIVVQCSPNVLAPILALPEFTPVERMLRQAAGGLHFGEKTAARWSPLLHALTAQDKTTGFITLLQVLTGLAEEKAAPLCHTARPAHGTTDVARRINKVLLFVEKHYAGRISLEETAALIHLSRSAFCKFFKRHMGRSFTQYLNEIRINRACFLLLDTDHSIQHIAHASGFDNLSYFNRTFAKLKQQKPSDYRRRMG